LFFKERQGAIMNTKKTFNSPRMRANVLAAAIAEFRKYDPEMPIQQAVLLLLVFLTPGISMKDLSESAGLAQSSVSRSVAALSKVHRLGKPGLDLVVAEEDPAERRRKIVRLTRRGELLMEDIVSKFDALTDGNGNGKEAA
jgi:DNA-binding MarR family transcriptional regulator